MRSLRSVTRLTHNFSLERKKKRKSNSSFAKIFSSDAKLWRLEKLKLKWLKNHWDFWRMRSLTKKNNSLLMSIIFRNEISEMKFDELIWEFVRVSIEFSISKLFSENYCSSISPSDRLINDNLSLNLKEFTMNF